MRCIEVKGAGGGPYTRSLPGRWRAIFPVASWRSSEYERTGSGVLRGTPPSPSHISPPIPTTLVVRAPQQAEPRPTSSPRREIYSGRRSTFYRKAEVFDHIFILYQGSVCEFGQRGAKFWLRKTRPSILPDQQVRPDKSGPARFHERPRKTRTRRTRPAPGPPVALPGRAARQAGQA